MKGLVTALNSTSILSVPNVFAVVVVQVSLSLLILQDVLYLAEATEERISEK